jgi:hypothetical protein
MRRTTVLTRAALFVWSAGSKGIELPDPGARRLLFRSPPKTELFFAGARRPKYLLRLFGAEHLSPYQYEQPQLGVVERVTIAFFDAFLKHEPGALRHLVSVGNVPGIGALLANP